MSGARTEIFTVEKSAPDERIDRFLTARYAAVSRGAIQRLIEEAHIKVNGLAIKPTYNPRAGDVIEVFFPEARPPVTRPEDIPLDIIFEDSDLLVMNKAPGIVVHPSVGHEGHTLVNALLHHCAGNLSGIRGVAQPGIVHRLDKDTSGCLVVAKNDIAHLALSEQFAARTTKKSYLAILCGEVPNKSGEIDAAIARHPSHRKRMAVSRGEAGREARTSYRVLERLRCSTFVEADLHTGRTHQLRVHFQHIGFPVAGDDTYGKKQTATLAGLTGFKPPRVLLHSHTLAFVHPRTGRLRRFTAPWPEDFKAALEALRNPPS
ncbi:MAG: rRNA synthase [Verrucomicrobiota bacterium]|jgi:23S rRNA pseudouridine1911/1915/1917 synthase